MGRGRRSRFAAQGAPSCNGWTFWHVETRQGLKLIDELRAENEALLALP